MGGEIKTTVKCKENKKDKEIRTSSCFQVVEFEASSKEVTDEKKEEWRLLQWCAQLVKKRRKGRWKAEEEEIQRKCHTVVQPVS